jgi:hypothetical protein
MPFFDLRQIGLLYGLPVGLWIYSKQFIIIGKFFGGAIHLSVWGPNNCDPSGICLHCQSSDIVDWVIS